MSMSIRVRRTLATLVAVVIVTTGTLSVASAANAAKPPKPTPSPTATQPPPTPASQVLRMAALGDSITQALMTCSSLSGCPVNSWATGSTSSVSSHYLRLRAAGSTSLVAYNDSVSGALSTTLNTQAQNAVSQQAQYVTVEIGANDACTSSEGTMTATADFKANVAAALTTLATSSSAPQIFVASIPSLQRLYEVNKGSSSARFTWGLLKICQSMLANPLGTTDADKARRIAVQQRVNEYNAALVEVCAATAKCRYDGGAVADYQFAASDISTRDYFHPSLAGQTKLAAITWPKTQWVAP